MPLTAPELDSRRYDELKRQALLRIPRYTPEWTDFNESDPGVTLVELFAWLTDMMLYQMNQVPERSYIKFLQLLGMELAPAEPARAHLTFTARAGVPVATVRRNSQVTAQVPGAAPLIFETTEDLELIRLPLTQVQVFDGAGFTNMTTANQAPGTGYRPFGWTPQPGCALYLGFEQTQPPAASPAFPRSMHWRVFLPAEEVAGQPVTCQTVQAAPAPPVDLAWEYHRGGTPGQWRRLSTFQDGSAAFTREGYLAIEGPRPGDHTPSVEGLVPDLLFWVRVRIASGSYAAGREPRIDFIRPNVVEAENLSTVRGETLGVSDASPSQVFTLRQRPVVRDSLELFVEEQDPEQDNLPWMRKEDFLASGPEDRHYTLNHATGEVRFGDGRRGRIPVAAAVIRAGVYRYGGGNAGNVAPGSITALLTQVDGIASVTNERKAVGGRDEQDVEEFKQQAPAMLRHAGRAVSDDDFAALAREVGGIARAVALPLFHPDFPEVKVPGAVTVVVVPDTLDKPPKPSPDELEAVCRYLDGRRLLTTELYVKGPEYKAIRVEARVAANPYAAFGDVERSVIAAINQYLDPLGGTSRRQSGSDAGANADSARPPAKISSSQVGGGSDFGLDLYPTNLVSVILSVADVRAVPSLTLTVDGVPHDDLTERIRVRPDAMVYGAPDHDILVEPYVDL